MSQKSLPCRDGAKIQTDDESGFLLNFQWDDLCSASLYGFRISGSYSIGDFRRPINQNKRAMQDTNYTGNRI